MIAATIKPGIITPSWLSTSGLLTMSNPASRPAASMMGSDIRNEKRAAAGRSSWRAMPPVMVAPEREMPGKIATAWKKPVTSASSQVMPSSFFVRLPSVSPSSSKAAVTSMKRAAARAGKGCFYLVFDRHACQPCRYGCQHDQPAQPSGRLSEWLAPPQPAQHCRDDRRQVAPEIGRHTHQRGYLHEHIVHKGFSCWDVPAQQRRHQHQVPRAGDGQEFGDALHDA